VPPKPTAKKRKRATTGAHIPSSSQLQRAKAEGWDEWIRTPQDEIAVARGCYFDEDAALRTRQFFENHLSHGKAPFAGMPFTLLDWQWLDVMGPIYGWKMPDGTRRFLSGYVEIPKKNGKSQLAAGISIRELYEQIGARVYLAAVASGQAADCYDEAAGMIERNALLHASIDVRRSTYRLLLRSRNANLSCMTTDKGSSQGKNASCLILDELHEWKDRGFFGSILYADTARINSLVFMITTAGDDLTSICYEEHERAERIIDGKDPSIDHLAVIYAADRDADPKTVWRDLDQWKKANPSYGITLPERKCQRAIDQAAGSPQRIGDLKRYRLNIWTKPRDAWLDVAAWDALPNLTAADCYGKRCYGGLDLARVRDFAALARAFDLGDGIVGFQVRIWVPADLVAEKQTTDKIPLASWVDQGHVITVPGNELDYAVIRRQILADHRATPMNEMGYDPYNAAQLANQQLGAEDGMTVVEVPQTMPYMGPASCEFERLLGARKIAHEHNPCLSWMVGGAIAQMDSNGNVRPIKRRSRTRIDGLVACIIALNRKNAGGGPKHAYYNDREPEFV
jgi:phage terminase large subunit-like protein